jgi:hypothetical protein
MSFFTRPAAARAGRSTGLVLAFGLVLAASALAAPTPFKANPADQAAATAAVAQRRDFGGDWSGGATKPDLSADTGCADWNPKQSDLLVTGAAATSYKAPGMQIDTEVHVLKSSAMVRLDWQRTIVAPRMLSCLREGFAKEVTAAGTEVVSVKRLPFPRLTSQTTAFQALIDITRNGSTGRLMVDIVVIGKGRSELTLVTSAPYAAQAAVKAGEVRVARILTARLLT